MKIVDLEVCNGGKDDGVPSSLLRDIAISSQLQNRVCYAEVQNKNHPQGPEDFSSLLVVIYPYETYNLREFCQKNQFDIRVLLF
jgi:hypothetical protein